MKSQQITQKPQQLGNSDYGIAHNPPWSSGSQQKWTTATSRIVSINSSPDTSGMKAHHSHHFDSRHQGYWSCGNLKRQHRCFSCGQRGHYARSCEQPSPSSFNWRRRSPSSRSYNFFRGRADMDLDWRSHQSIDQNGKMSPNMVNFDNPHQRMREWNSGSQVCEPRSKIHCNSNLSQVASQGVENNSAVSNLSMGLDGYSPCLADKPNIPKSDLSVDTSRICQDVNTSPASIVKLPDSCQEKPTKPKRKHRCFTCGARGHYARNCNAPRCRFGHVICCPTVSSWRGRSSIPPPWFQTSAPVKTGNAMLWRKSPDPARSVPRTSPTTTTFHRNSSHHKCDWSSRRVEGPIFVSFSEEESIELPPDIRFRPILGRG